MKTLTLEQIAGEAESGIHDAASVSRAIKRLTGGEPFELVTTRGELAVRGHTMIWALADRVVSPAGVVLKDRDGPAKGVCRG